jgi:DNA-binding NarL/FixJ family response regulator
MTDSVTQSVAQSIRILVADDHPVVRDGLVSMLGTQADFEVVGEAATGVETVRQTLALHPDIVLIDLEMPEMDGVEAIRQLRGTAPETHMIVLTAFDSDERIVGALEAGAQGYLLKGAPRSDIFHAIRVVSAGGSLLQPVVASKLLRHITSRVLDQGMNESLTAREMEVLRLLAQGKVNKEIAITLAITERTVKFHVSAIMGKLNAGNRTEAVTIAAQRGLIEL